MTERASRTHGAEAGEVERAVGLRDMSPRACGSCKGQVECQYTADRSDATTKLIERLTEPAETSLVVLANSLLLKRVVV